MATVSIIYRKDKINKKGLCPIHFRIIKNRKISYLSTGVLIPEEMWDEEKLRIKAKHKNSARLNAFISKKYSELQDSVIEHETFSKSTTTRQLKEDINGKVPSPFFQFAFDTVASYKAEGKISTHITHNSTVNTLKEYVRTDNFMFQDMTPEFLTKYERYLRTEQKLKTNTIHKHLKFFRKLFNDALRLDLIKYEHNPFNKYKLKTEKTNRQYLTDEELQAVIDISTKAGERLDLHKDMFVFASYAGGLRVSDVLKLKWQNFDGTHINITIHKTKSQLSIKLPNRAVDIINKYRRPDSKQTDFIFPMLDNSVNLQNPQEAYTEISSATAYINKNLKVLAAKANLEKPLTFHISRHTWATKALRKGVSIDKVSKILGHAQLRETQIYAKLANKELDKAMEAFND